MKNNELALEQDRMFSSLDLRALIIPLMIEQFLARTVGMLDTVMVSSVGESAVSGVSLVDTINTLMITLFSALAAGGAIVAGQYLGSKNREQGSKAAQQLIFTTGFLSLIIAVVAVAFNKQILSLLFGQIEPSVMQNARSYFYVTAVSFPFIAIYNSCAALFRGMGNSRVAMMTAFIMNIINVGGNAFFIYKIDMGVFGAGLSTTIARIVAAIILIVMIRNPELKISIESYSLRNFDSSMVKRILKIGIPNGLENSIFQIGKIIVTSLVATMGTSAITAHGVATSLISIPVGPGSAIGLALTTVVAQCVGAREYKQADYYIGRLVKFSYISLFILNILILILLKPILSLYNLSGTTYDTTIQLMMFHGIIAIIFWSTSFALPNGLRAAGDVTFTMIVAIFSMMVFRIGFSYLLVKVFDVGVISVWIAMGIDWVFRSLLFVWRWKSGKWQNKAIT